MLINGIKTQGELMECAKGEPGAGGAKLNAPYNLRVICEQKVWQRNKIDTSFSHSLNVVLER